MSGVTDQEEENKPAGSSEFINLKVLGQHGSEVYFRIKRISPLKKLINAYCDRKSVALKTVTFMFDGQQLKGEETPDELEMEDGDEIDAMLHQMGGAML